MHIKDVEQRTGLSRANIRYYEQEGLVHPARRKNGYRDYSPDDLETLLRIRLLRRLDVPIEEIRAMQAGKLSLSEALSPAAGGPAPPGGAGPDGSVRVPGHAGRPRLL